MNGCNIKYGYAQLYTFASSAEQNISLSRAVVNSGNVDLFLLQIVYDQLMLTVSGSCLLQPAQNPPVAQPVLSSTPAAQVTPSPTPAPQAPTQAPTQAPSSLVLQE